jgi:hypothetical protein
VIIRFWSPLIPLLLCFLLTSCNTYTGNALEHPTLQKLIFFPLAPLMDVATGGQGYAKQEERTRRQNAIEERRQCRASLDEATSRERQTLLTAKAATVTSEDADVCFRNEQQCIGSLTLAMEQGQDTQNWPSCAGFYDICVHPPLTQNEEEQASEAAERDTGCSREN